MRVRNSQKYHLCTAFMIFCFTQWTIARGLAQERQIHSFARQQLTDIYFSEGIAVGQLNGDSHLDVVYGPYWFAGPDFQTKHEIFDAQPQPTERYANHFFAWVHDFNSDGAGDVFTVGFPGTPAYVYENPGNGIGEWARHEVIDSVANESPHFCNLTGDDLPELICTHNGFFGFATIDSEDPFGRWQFTEISDRIAPVKFGHGLGVGDVNADGRLDIIHANGWFEQPPTDPEKNRWNAHRNQFSTGGGGAEMHAYDVDGDGDNDIITSESAHNFGLSWYENLLVNSDGESKKGQFQQYTIVGSHPSDSRYGVLFSEPHSVALADVDGDGLKDIVTGKTYWSHHRKSPMWDAGAVVYWFRLARTNEGIDWIPYQLSRETGIGRQLTVADIDQDGLLDIATGGMLGANILMHRTETVSVAEFAAAQPKRYDGPGRPPEVSSPIGSVSGVRLRGGRIPLQRDGHVAKATEGETVPAVVSRGSVRTQSMAGFSSDSWSAGEQLWWTGGRPGDRLAIELDLLQPSDALQFALTCAKDYAVVQPLLDDKPLGEPIDLYEPNVVSTGMLTYPAQLKPGKHRLSFEIVGANRAAVKSYMFGLDYLAFQPAGQQERTAGPGIAATLDDGTQLNLDFEIGTLQSWKATGEAFSEQPVQGDTVALRRDDMRSRHLGQYWIGSYERHGDSATGTLTSAAFPPLHRYASFYVGGGSSKQCRVELWVQGDDKPFYVVSGQDDEQLRPVTVDLRRAEGKLMYIRLVDEATGGWGHINFDHFRFFARRPQQLTPIDQRLVEDEYPHSGLEAEAAAAAMQVPEGFHVTVMATEPDVKQPIAMALDDQGRVWIAEAYEYPIRAKGDQGRDRILVFEDTTGDGRLDSRKVFAEGLNLVSGLEVGFGGVWVGAAPYLMFIPDANQDDVPDGPPQILLDGWGYEDTHETLNAFCWGPDGWLYGCHGVFTHSKVGKPGTAEKDRVPLNAGVWRFHPTTHTFEVFAHGTSNPWGVDFNAHGEAFITACVIPHLYHMIPGGRYQRQAGQHFNPNTYDDIKTIADHLHYLGATPHSGNNKSDEAGGGHAHSGAMIYQGGAWPDQYAGALFMNNIHGQRLNVDLLAPEGSGYVGRHGKDFLLTGDMASQILNMRYGPDGQVIFIDWYDMQACHRRDVEVHDRSNGRIYKVSYGAPEPVKVDLAKLSDLELAKLCLHENDWFVRHSRRLLQQRAAVRDIDSDARQFLATVVRENADDRRRLRALWASYATGALNPDLLHTSLRADSPYLRSWAIRLFIEQANYRLTEHQLQTLAKVAGDDASQVVRRQVASSLGRLPLEARWDIAAKLVTHSEDASDHNLPLLYWYAIEPLAASDPDRALALGMTAGDTIPLLRTFMMRRVAGSGTDDAIARLVRALTKQPDTAIQLDFLAAIRKALGGQRRADAPAGWSAAYAALREKTESSLHLHAAALAARFGDSDASELLMETIVSSDAPVAARLLALEALVEVGEPNVVAPLLEQVEDGDNPPQIVIASIRGLAQFDDPVVAERLIRQYDQLDATARRAAIATLCARATSAHLLLDEIQAGRITAAELSADLARQLEYLDDPLLKGKLSEVWGQVRESSSDRAQQIAEYKTLVNDSTLPDADPQLGRAIFAKTCQRCHALYGEGQNLGPDLTGSNRANLDYLLENIVDPSAVMSKEYRQSILLTLDGQIITGIVREETPRAITIQSAEALVVVPRDEIDGRHDSEVSMMPENQLAQFNSHEIRSLIAYLRSKRQVPAAGAGE